MQITMETDYAIRIVDYLSRSCRRVGAQEISENSSVTLRFALKILRKLVRGGFVRSFKGAQGGYEIAKPLDQISVGAIMELIEGPFLMNRCLREGHKCHRDEECPYHAQFYQISQDIQSRLYAITMQSVIGAD